MCYSFVFPLQSERYVSLQLQQKSQEIIDNSVRKVEVLSEYRQSPWAMLCQSTMSMFE